ncbi:hypothetical protein EJ110_NYTH14922 [Nymphaea thermarum]|nr:hypothetical protein EJ110_NYTH14922 [Nymphaea thermarum]
MVGPDGSAEPMALGGDAESVNRGDMVVPGWSGEPMDLGGVAEPANRGMVLPAAINLIHGKSWASIVDGGRVDEEMSLPPLEKKEISGKKRPTISQQSYERLCQPFQFSAIATLAGGAGKGRLDYSFIFASLKSLWPGVADLKFTSVGKCMFLLRTSSEVDLKFIWSPGRWYVGERLLIANQWHPGMPMRIESSNRVRIWIRLPDLPVEWWNPRIFTDIAAELIGGSFVEADEYTRHLHRFGFARIKIEMPLGFSPISEIKMEISGGKIFVQTIEYETKVEYCHKCGSTTPFEGSCVIPSALPEIKNDKENYAKSLGGKATDSSEEKEKGLTNVAEANRAEEAAFPVAQSTKQGTEVVQASQAALVPPGPTTSTLNGHAKKRTLKHREVNGTKKRINPPKESDRNVKTGGCLQEKTDLTMVEVTPVLEEGPPSDDMDVGNVVAKIGSEAMDNDYEDDSSNKSKYKVQEMQLASNIHISGLWAPIIALWDPYEVSLLNCREPSQITMSFCFIYLNVGTTLGSISFPPLSVLAGYSDLVRSAWVVDTRGCAMIKLIHKLKATRDKLKIWYKGEANNLTNQIMAMKTSIKFIQTQCECDMSEAIEEECRLKHELSRLLWLEERLWRQKSRIKWLRDGDLNTKFFQGIANGRRRRNKIETITHEGRLATDSLENFTACTDFFATLLGSTHGSGCLPQSIAPGPTVTSEENDELLKPINDTKIKWAVMEADRDSAPGPDGDLSETNQANLAFLVYRVSQQSSPWAELVRGRYYERKALTDSSIRGKRVSKAWRGALQAWSRIKGDICWKIGKASFGGTIIGKEPNITKFVTGFALGSLEAMEASMMIDGLKSTSLRGARAAKKEWQASLETSLVGSVLAWLAGLRTTQGSGRQRFFWNALGTW